MIRSGVRLDQTASHQGRRIERARDKLGFVRDNFAAGGSPLYEGECARKFYPARWIFQRKSTWHE